MSIVFYPSVLKGEITVPPSKSHTLRAVLLAAFAKGDSIISNVLLSPDLKHLLKILTQCGVSYKWLSKQTLNIQGSDGNFFLKPGTVFDCGNSGIILRFLMALFAKHDQRVHFNGDHSLQTLRSLAALSDALVSLGADISYQGTPNYVPLILEGPVQVGSLKMNGQDSQPISAMLLLAAYLKGITSISVQSPREKPWIDLTLSWLDRLGIEYCRKAYDHFIVKGQGGWHGFEYTVPGDWSTAMYLIAAAAMSESTLVIRGLDCHDPQGDKILLDTMRSAVVVNDISQSVQITGPITFPGGVIDCDECIDMLSLIAVLAATAEQETTIKHIQPARYKECDRVTASQALLESIGCAVTTDLDTMHIQPSTRMGDITLLSLADHRMVLTAMVLAQSAQRSVTIDDIHCVNKTFPDFLKQMKMIGLKVAA